MEAMIEGRMNSLSFGIRFAISIMIILLFAGAGEMAYDNTLISLICNQNEFESLYPSYSFSSYVADYMILITSQNVGAVVARHVQGIDSSETPPGLIFGAGYCKATLSLEECSSCMFWAKFRLFRGCGYRTSGAQVHLKDCDLRLETYSITDVK